MKAVILEIIKEKAVVMKENGTVRRVRNRNYSVGDEIYMKEGIFSHRKWAPIVAALLIFAMVGTGTWAYATPAYEISVMDGDGSEFLFRVNKVNKVIGVSTDEDDEDYDPIDSEIYEGKDINEAIILMLNDMEYYEEDFDELLITAIAKNKEESERVAKSLQERMEEYWAEKEPDEEAQIEDNDSGSEKIKKDRSLKVNGLSEDDLVILSDYDITPGKLNIVRNLMDLDHEERNYVENYLKSLKGDLEEDEDLSKKIMEEFSARNGEKNNPSVNAPGQVDKEDKEKKEKDTPPGLENKLEEGTTLRESRELDSDDDNDLEDENEEDTDESRRPESPGNSNEAPGQSKSKNR